MLKSNYQQDVDGSQVATFLWFLIWVKSKEKENWKKKVKRQIANLLYQNGEPKRLIFYGTKQTDKRKEQKRKLIYPKRT